MTSLRSRIPENLKCNHAFDEIYAESSTQLCLLFKLIKKYGPNVICHYATSFKPC